MSVNRVVVHKRNQSPAHIDQLGTTIPMAELFAVQEDEPAQPSKPRSERPARLVPIPLEEALTAGDLPHAFAGGRTLHAVVLELDRIFPDASRWHLMALESALQRFGIGMPPNARGSVRDVLETLSQEHRLPRFLHKALESLAKSLLDELLRTRCHPRVETELLVSRLRARGLRIAVRSPLPGKKTRLILEMSGLRNQVDDIVCCEDLSVAGCIKDELLSICAHLGLKPRQVLSVEGIPEGIESARAAGLRTCELLPRETVDWPRLQRRIQEIESSEEGDLEC